jgi:hypothetical protein
MNASPAVATLDPLGQWQLVLEDVGFAVVHIAP